jgi:hypothetical protein
MRSGSPLGTASSALEDSGGVRMMRLAYDDALDRTVSTKVFGEGHHAMRRGLAFTTRYALPAVQPSRQP